MRLSDSEINHLREEYENLVQYFPDEREELFLSKKEEIIQYCIDNDIRLYSIVELPMMETASLLQKLLSYFVNPSSVEKNAKDEEDWAEEFQVAIDEVNEELAQLHDEALPTLGQMYLKKGSIPVSTLLNQQDMIDLFNDEDYLTDDIVTTEPFSLTVISSEQVERIKLLINREENNGKDVFLPVSHDGHWYYISREAGTWSVQDSQPTSGHFLTPRQESIFTETENFLTSLLDDQDYGELVYETTGKQDKAYDCGAHVINAYRKRVDDHYEESSHREVIEEVLSLQLPELESYLIEGDDFNEDFDDEFFPLDFEYDEDNLSSEYVLDNSEPAQFLEEPMIDLDLDKIHQVIETTVSSQANPIQAESYKDNLQEMVDAIVSKGLFSNIKNPIDLDKINTAEAAVGESEEEFVARLQEAEFRSAGLKK